MLQNWRIWQGFIKGLGKLLLIISENSNFGENGQFGKNLSKVWQKLKQGDKRRMSLIVGFYENAIVCEINKFLDKSIKGFTKFKRDDKNEHLVQIVIIRIWQTSAKIGEYAKIHQGFGQIFK